VASSRLAVLLVLAAVAGAGCGGRQVGSGGDTASAEVEAVRLEARPGRGAIACKPGLHELSLPAGGRALLRVGPRAAGRPRALILALHGAGESPRDALWAFRGADDEPVVVVAPSAGDDGWSLGRPGGGDIARIDRALARAFARCRIDRTHVAIGGFSAGGSLALSLGLANGDLFDAVIALSPGGILTEARKRSPRIFVAHGTRDRRIPIEAGAGAIVPSLRSAGYDVELRRFDGGHEVPRGISEAAVSWFLWR
jgi:predicted esterase